MPQEPPSILHQTALIAEYVALAKTGLPTTSPSDFARMNGLALRCLMELPSTTWIRVVEAMKTPTWQSALDIAMDMRGEIYPDDPIAPEYHVFHGPNVSNGVKR